MSAAALIMRGAGLALRVFLTGRLGADGIGVYQLILSVYAFFALVSCSGVSITVTCLVSELMAKEEKEKAAWTTERIIMFSVSVGAVLGVFMYFFSEQIADSFLSCRAAAPALRILSPSLPFMAYSASTRGYFTARRNILPNTIEQLIEQAVEIGVCVLLFYAFTPSKLSTSCSFAAAGTTSAEVISFVYSLIVYKADVRKLTKKRKRQPSLLRKAIPVFVPCTLSSGLRSALSAAENILIPAGLIRYGFSAGKAMAEYGRISGMAMPVILFPTVFVTPFASLIVTEMSQAKARNDTKAAARMVLKMISATLHYSIPVMVMTAFFSHDISMLLYGSDETAVYIAALAPVIPLMYLDSTVDGMLKGLGEQTSYFLFNLADSVIRVALVFFLLPVSGPAGVIIVMVFSELFNTFLSVWRLISVSRIKPDLRKLILRPALCIAVPCALTALLHQAPFAPWVFLLKLLFCVSFYIPALFFTVYRRKDHKVERAAVSCSPFRRLLK